MLSPKNMTRSATEGLSKKTAKEEKRADALFFLEVSIMGTNTQIV